MSDVNMQSAEDQSEGQPKDQPRDQPKDHSVNDEPQPESTPNPQPAPKRKLPLPAKVALVALAALLAIVAAGTAWFAWAANQGEQNLKKEASTDASTIQYKGKTYTYNKDVVSILVTGYDNDFQATGKQGISLADANFLVCIDTKTNDIKVCAIPRNSITDVDVYKDGTYSYTDKMQLCLAYIASKNTEPLAAENTVKSVRNIFYGLPITYYAAFNEEVLKEIVDELGGVKVTVKQTVPGTRMRKGSELILSGDEAWRYLSWRDTDVDESALDRQARQMEFVQALFAQLKGADASKYVGLFNAVSKHMVTNLGSSEITYLASNLAAGAKGQVSYSQLKGTTTWAKDATGEELERYNLQNGSVKKTALDLFYTESK